MKEFIIKRFREIGVIEPILDEQVGKKVHEICRKKYNYYYLINGSMGWRDTLPLALKRRDHTVGFGDYINYFGEQGKRYYAELVDINNCLNYGWEDSWFDINEVVNYLLIRLTDFDVVVVDVFTDTSIIGEDGYGRFLNMSSFENYRSMYNARKLPSLIMDSNYSFLLYTPMGVHFPYYILLSDHCCDTFVDNVNIHQLDPDTELDDFDVTSRFR